MGIGRVTGRGGEAGPFAAVWGQTGGVGRVLGMLLLVVALAACGSGVQPKPEVAGDGRGAVFDSAGFCDALARIAAADRRAGQDADGLQGWAEVQPLIVESSNESADLYEEAHAVAPPEVEAQLALVARVTRDLADVAAAAESRREFQQQGEQVDSFADAQQAVVLLNGYAQRTCGFTLVDN